MSHKDKVKEKISKLKRKLKSIEDEEKSKVSTTSKKKRV